MLFLRNFFKKLVVEAKMYDEEHFCKEKISSKDEEREMCEQEKRQNL